MKAQVKVKSLGNIGDIFTNPIVLTVLVFVLIIAGYLVYQRKIKNNA